MFAVDSVPAVFAVSSDPFIVYSSNVFAILGMRALYLVLADLLRGLAYLHYGLAAILGLAGAKMLLSDVVHVPPIVSLGLIVAILAAAIIPSVALARRQRHAQCSS
jgi:tellurite resistance protein TerC